MSWQRSYIMTTPVKAKCVMYTGVYAWILLNIFSCNPSSDMKDNGEVYDLICLEGHVYWASYHMLAIKLTDDGKPVKRSEIKP